MNILHLYRIFLRECKGIEKQYLRIKIKNIIKNEFRKNINTSIAYLLIQDAYKYLRLLKSLVKTKKSINLKDSIKEKKLIQPYQAIEEEWPW